MLDINSITAILILLLPLVVDALKRLFPTNSTVALQILIGVVSLVATIIVEATTTPFVTVSDFISRLVVIFGAAQLMYDKLWAGTGISKVLSGTK